MKTVIDKKLDLLISKTDVSLEHLPRIYEIFLYEKRLIEKLDNVVKPVYRDYTRRKNPN